MNISIFGLGYVGAVLTGCFARDGHRIIGVDTDSTKVGLINDGKSPIIEKDLPELIAGGVKAGFVSATTDAQAAVLTTEMSMICVGTPSRPSGELDLTYVVRVCENIGAALKQKADYHLVVVRSTMLPGSVESTVIPALEKTSGKRCGTDFGVAINPEFLRESTAVHDFYHPPKTVVGAASKQDAETIGSLYARLEAPFIHTSLRVAEMVKYADNCFHALKITFANEIGLLCKELGVDSRAVMDIFCQDRKLNLSPAYLRPGFAYGGSCLPKDLRAINRLAVVKDVNVPVLGSIAASNEHQIQNALRLIASKGKRKIGVLGFAFKGGTDDLRESPVVTLIEALIGKGCDVRLYDSYVSLARLVGANRRYIEQHIPHISRLMVDSVAEVIQHSELVVIGNENDEFYQAIERLGPDGIIIDLTATTRKVSTSASYERIAG
ncbi:MAG: nucleotide sugar dehydrogenase [Verrucomicrobiota bacterium]